MHGTESEQKRMSWKTEFRLCVTLGEGRGMAIVYLQGGEGGRSTARPPAKPAPEMKQQRLPCGANVGLQTLTYRLEMQSPGLGTYPPILCRGKVRCLRSATQTQSYTDWGVKFGK